MSNKILPLAATVGIALALAGCVNSTAPVSAAGATTAASPAQAFSPAEALAGINAYRAASGLAPVRLDAAAARAARSHSETMARQGVLSHEAGGDLRTRLAAVGVARVPAVENVAWGTRSFADTLRLWQSSSQHNQNLQAPDVSRMGIAVSNGASGPYWSLVMLGG